MHGCSFVLAFQVEGVIQNAAGNIDQPAAESGTGINDSGVDRQKVYVTNAVKHFKFEPRGKRRIHSKPNAGEIQACRWWLDNERRLVRPQVIVALGATAARSVFGRPVAVMKARGPAGALEDGAKGFVTVHPSMLLRIPDRAAKAAAFRDFVRDLEGAWELVEA